MRKKISKWKKYTGYEKDRLFHNIIFGFLGGVCFALLLIGFSMTSGDIYPGGIYTAQGYEKVEIYLDKLNPKLYENVSSFRFEPFNLDYLDITFMTKDIRTWFNSYSGTYMIYAKRISVYVMEDGYTPESYRLTLDHEICHHIWYTRLNNFERNTWEYMYLNSNWSVTEYANTNVKENFAEYCGEYIANNVMEINKKIKERGFEYVKNIGMTSNVNYFYDVNRDENKRKFLDKMFRNMGITDLYQPYKS